MSSQRIGSASRRTAADARAADARALRAARAIAAAAARGLAEPPLEIPPVLLSTPSPTRWSSKTREERIAEEAYLRAASRGFEPGHELEDWLAAERMIDGALLAE